MSVIAIYRQRRKDVEVLILLCWFGAAFAMPERRTVRVPLKSSEMLTDPSHGPTSVGVNVTLIMHVLPTASGDRDRQLSFSEKSPVMLNPDISIGAYVLLVREICFGLLLIPTVWLPKFSELADGSSAWGGTMIGIVM